MSETISFEIKALQSDATTPIPNAEIQLENSNLGQNPKTDSQGIASFEIESTQHLKPFRAKLIHKDYQEYPIQDRVIILNSMKRREKPLELRFRGKLDSFAVQQIKLEPQTITLKDANNEIITKNFYKRGDTLTFTASIDTSKAQESEIKWAYKILNEKEQSLLQQKDSKTYNPLNKTTLNPTINDIPSELKQILQDKDNNAYFSNQSAYTIKDFKNNTQETESLYKGKTLTITIHENFENTKQQVAIAIFAYKYEPNWQVCQIIRLNDYPQITIDCTLAETLRAYTRQDNIATLGFGVSYVCQRLWHDNPSDAKELSELIYRDSHSPDFMESIPNATMQKIVKEVLPRIELKEIVRKYKDIADKTYQEQQRIHKDFEAYKQRYNFSRKKDKEKHIGLNASGDMIPFYVELDWDRFYMQFPLMKNLEKEMLNIQIEPIYIQTTGMPTGEYKNKSKILTLNFLHSMQSFMCSKSDILYQALHNKTASNMQVVANLNAIASNPKGAKMPKSISKNIDSKTHTITALDIEYEDINHTIFSIKANDMPLAQAQKDMDSLTPKDLMRHHMQYYSISDIDFGLEYKLSFEEKSNQAIALYALSGKFQIYYVLDSFEVERINEKEIAIYPTQIKAYIDDSFDFRDQPMQFVGAWDYEKISFLTKTSEYQRIIYDNAVDIVNKLPFVERDKNTSKDFKEVIMRNHDYQNTQKYFNLGLDFLVTSPTFKNIKIPKDLKFKNLFKIVITLGEYQ